jgi:hypothetical protein
MFRQSPDYYRESLVMAEIWGTIAEELAAVDADNEDIILQMHINTATWGLDIWEKTLNLVTFTDKPYTQRRERILATLRGMGGVNAELLKDVAESYDGGEIEIINNSAAYQFTVKFISTLGTPENLDDLKAVVEEIKPAHLEVLWAFRYLLIKEIHNVMTLSEMETHVLTDFAPFTTV